MSIQAAREKIANNQASLLKADAKFFGDLQTAFNRLGQGSHVADYRRLENSVQLWLQNWVSSDNWTAETHQSAYDGAMGWKSLLENEIGLRVHALEAAGGVATPSGWINAETGAPVQVYAPGESVALHGVGARDGRSSANLRQVSLGALINGLLVGPRSQDVRNALSEGEATAGGYSVPVEVLRQFIDKLRAKTQFIKAGGRTIVLDTLKTVVMRTESDPVATWRAENQEINQSEPTFGAVTFTARSLACCVVVSRELIQDTVNADAAIEAALIGALSVELDRACLFGSGVGIEPLGIYNTPGINVVSMGVNGGTPTNYDEFVDAIYEMEAGNAAEPSAAIMHPRTSKTYRKLKDTLGQPMRMPESIASLDMLSTTSVPVNLVQGTSNNSSAVIVGDFSRAILGIRQELRIEVNPYLFGNKLQIVFVANLRADVAVEHPESFTAIKGIEP